MHLDSHYLSVLPKLMHTGSSEHIQGKLELQGIDIGSRHFDLLDGISYEASLINTGEAVLLSGTADAVLNTNCDRCLETTQLSIVGEIQGYYLFDASTIKEGESLEVYEEVDVKGRIDIAPPVLAAIVIELPAVVLCKPECSGVLTKTPENTLDKKQAIVSETTAQDNAEDIDPESPFALLKDFKFED